MGEYICKICGKSFERKGNSVYCPGPHYRPCPVCGKPVEFHRLSDPIRCCSPECVKELANATKSSKGLRLCKECGKPFQPKQANQLYCKEPHTTNCIICNKLITYTCAPPDKPKTCSKRCQQILKAHTVESRYGVTNVSQIDSVKQKISDSKTDKVGYFLNKASSKKSAKTFTIRVCKFCGKEFEAYGTTEYCDGPHYKNCIVCNQEFEWDHRRPKDCCSPKCSTILRSQSIGESTRVCQICGKLFTPRSGMQLYCDDQHYSNCPICGKLVPIKYAYERNRCCSTECSNQLRKQTTMNKYGVPVASQALSVRQKLHYTCSSPEYLAKRAARSLEKWGVTNPSKNPELRKRIAETLRSSLSRSKFRATSLMNHGVPHPMQSQNIVDRYRSTCEEKYGIPFYCMSDDCKSAQGHIVSKINAAIADTLRSYGIDCDYEFRLGRYSFDLRIKDTNTLLEINPTFTHNSAINPWGVPLDKYYHRNKTRFALENGYRCINVWDWDNINHIVDILKPRSFIYARKCEIAEIDSQVASTFESQFHIQGSVRGQSICLGLYYNGELVEVMTFGSPRYNKHYEYELLRLCSRADLAIIGGAERLWNHFIKSYAPISVISYCDASKFSGSVYRRLDMKLDEITEPNKNWSKNHELITNNLLLQRGFDQIFNTSYGKGTSNEELMVQNGWLPVYDCGQYRFIWKAD